MMHTVLWTYKYKSAAEHRLADCRRMMPDTTWEIIQTDIYCVARPWTAEDDRNGLRVIAVVA
jgi:hypothetical protein